MSGEWTPERRAAAAERIRATKPWTKSTGPKTKAGKERCSLNALKHGQRSAIKIAANKALKMSREFRGLALELLIDMNAESIRRARQTNYIKTPVSPDTCENKNHLSVTD